MGKKNKKNKSKIEKILTAIATVAYAGVIFTESKKLYDEAQEKKKAKAGQEETPTPAKHKKGLYERFIKRPQDFCCALAAIIVLSPIMAVTALLVRIRLGSPVIFTQDRPGLNGEVFKLYKFRSMTDARDENGELLPDDVRLTPFGQKLRSTSLDELPELFNILKGDMSVVGPRPLLVRYLERYNEHQARRHEVRPGFTGLAQVHGRNAITWEEKFDWDVQYVDNITFKGDWKIILDTVKVVLNREGISSESAATMEEFMGTPGEPAELAEESSETTEE